MRSTLYEADPEDFRATVRAWAEKTVAPFHAQWEVDGIVPREVWTSGGAQGLLGMDVDETYGGGGVRDFRYNAVVDEELARIGASGVGFTLHNDVTGPYLRDLATAEQKQRWLPGFVSGELRIQQLHVGEQLHAWIEPLLPGIVRTTRPAFFRR